MLGAAYVNDVHRLGIEDALEDRRQGLTGYARDLLSRVQVRTGFLIPGIELYRHEKVKHLYDMGYLEGMGGTEGMRSFIVTCRHESIALYENDP